MAIVIAVSSALSASAQAPAARDVGCHSDNPNADPLGTRGRDLDGAAFKNPSMTVKKCLGLCSDQGFKFAGLQNGSWCFCGDSYGRYKAGSASCTVKCAGDRKQVCGGEGANKVWELSAPEPAKLPGATPPAPATAPPASTPGTGQPLQRFNRPKLGGVRLDSRPGAGNCFDVVGVAHNFCRRMGFGQMTEYRVADATRTVAIEDGTMFTNSKGTNTTYRFIVCGP